MGYTRISARASTNLRTLNRKKRRDLLNSIISNLMLVVQENDTQIERISLIKLNSINIDTFDFLKWLRVDYRGVHGTHICTNGSDATAKT
jgi:hypothetical protein